MSAKFEAWFGGEKFEVEISRDGRMVFLGRDMDYEFAFGAMNGKPTGAARLLEEWQATPMFIVYANLGVPLDPMLRYMDDLERMAGQYGEAGLMTPAQSYLDGARNGAETLANHMRRNRDTFLSDVVWNNGGYFWSIAQEYALAVAAQRSGIQGENEESAAFEAAFDQEAARQIRHFVRIMEALQAGQPWPELPPPEGSS